jgi:hypothetical protein
LQAGFINRAAQANGFDRGSDQKSLAKSLAKSSAKAGRVPASPITIATIPIQTAKLKTTPVCSGHCPLTPAEILLGFGDVGGWRKNRWCC